MHAIFEKHTSTYCGDYGYWLAMGLDDPQWEGVEGRD